MRMFKSQSVLLWAFYRQGRNCLRVDEELVPGKIRNSNGPMIAAQLTRMGIDYKSYGMQADDLGCVYGNR